jgi:hypothetical protein
MAQYLHGTASTREFETIVEDLLCSAGVATTLLAPQ